MVAKNDQIKRRISFSLFSHLDLPPLFPLTHTFTLTHTHLDPLCSLPPSTPLPLPLPLPPSTASLPVASLEKNPPLDSMQCKKQKQSPLLLLHLIVDVFTRLLCLYPLLLLLCKVALFTRLACLYPLVIPLTATSHIRLSSSTRLLTYAP